MNSNFIDNLPRVPVSCFWKITTACNLRCIHCEGRAGTRSPDELSTNEAFALARSLKTAGCEKVILTGGEPLVRKDWPLLTQCLADLGMIPTIVTNGILVDDDMILKLTDSGVDSISISLDGNREVHDDIRVSPGNNSTSSYDSAVRAIELACNSRLRTAVITQIHRRNLDDLQRMYGQIADLGVDIWQVQICMPLGRLLDLRHEYMIEPSDIPALTAMLSRFVKDGRVAMAVADNIGYYDEHEPILRGSVTGHHSFWTGCKAGLRAAGISANGDVKGCPSHPDSFTVGNIRHMPFEKIWENRALFPYNTEWREELLEGECAICPFRRMCRAGCTTMAYSMTGTIYNNPFCAQRVRH